MRATTIRLRPPRPGDLGWVVQRHAELYFRERGWGAPFEALVCAVVADFARERDPRRERCWIAEAGGQRLGCVFLVAKSRRAAQLRLLLVEPAARGRGLGARLVAACERFARAKGYRRMTLWTHSVLAEARRIYERAGWRLVKSETHRRFGPAVTGETWEKPL